MKRYKNAESRDINGILLLDKPKGISSRVFLNKIKKLFNASKIGHTGTLDPLATGMLPICFGKATKFAKYLLHSDKRYKVIIQLGVNTDTFDSDGTVVSVMPVKFNNNTLEQCLASFRGINNQVPPMFSALKYRGLPLYKYARKGICIPRKPRLIHIYSLNLIRRTANIIELDVHCSKGTYIRSMVHDIGEYLGCGAHVIELRRLSVGEYVTSSMISLKILEAIFYNDSLDDLQVLYKLDAFLIPMSVITLKFSNISNEKC
ncbi:tRNA pseudouridine(55) synthase TruB [Blochmannia endosymbiont of Camponotus sp. C-046]|uniref:tRNA pseudouridine(55) synthase TruB n=1 Tax=Blochmannia endosymbiont of Camponotus sp. C-046 TaxID=2945589 RepID=UPI0020242666|nr:tRNA pseudouridine(55) synthase TruB [Blochmannia endosymbiont of Camponotus sp. C-046]URJ29048.1 tRNA pseudouridine(55) synthase TruB [Blochmannia endosymbiont of Camponotus sp. C-046]